MIAFAKSLMMVRIVGGREYDMSPELTHRLSFPGTAGILARPSEFPPPKGADKITMGEMH